jgi:hypothetical protein
MDPRSFKRWSRNGLMERPMQEFCTGLLSPMYGCAVRISGLLLVDVRGDEKSGHFLRMHERHRASSRLGLPLPGSTPCRLGLNGWTLGAQGLVITEGVPMCRDQECPNRPTCSANGRRAIAPRPPAPRNDPAAWIGLGRVALAADTRRRGILSLRLIDTAQTAAGSPAPADPQTHRQPVPAHRSCTPAPRDRRR